jgi:hypothetical protein
VDYTENEAKRRQSEIECLELVAAEVKKLGGELKRFKYVKDRPLFSIDLKSAKISDANLNLLAEAKGLTSLDLSFSGVTDKGVIRLTAAKDLSALELAGTKVTDQVIEPLRKMALLRLLNLAQTGVSERGIARLVQKNSLALCHTAVGEKAHFRAFQQYTNGKVSFNYLMIGDCYYGNFLIGSPAQHRLATTYYHRDGPVGRVMRKLEWFKPASLVDYPSDARLPASIVGLLSPVGPLPDRALTGLWAEPAVAVVRLNTGTQAAYGRPFQYVDFYNSTPEMKTFSFPPKAGQPYFGYIQEARQRGCTVRVIDGDERLSFARKAPRNFYGAVFVDITRNDLRDINTKLMTREALADMFSSVTDVGVVCFHTSHRYHNLVPPVADAARALGLVARVGKDPGVYPNSNHFSSEWVVVARRAEHLRHLTDAKGKGLKWSVVESNGRHLWRDGKDQDIRPLARSLGK